MAQTTTIETVTITRPLKLKEVVEAALLSDPKNHELLKLKENLEEVIVLSKELKTSFSEDDVYSPFSKDSESLKNSNSLSQNKQTKSVARKWKVGDKCLAKWSEDGQYHEAIIDNILPSKQVNVTFLAYRNRSTISLNDLKEIKEKFYNNSGDRKKNSREYLAKKKLKKEQRLKDLEMKREIEKNKWLAFKKKAAKKGIKNKSIFASPDTITGRVGVGTCGVSGKPMTEFTTPDKWFKKIDSMTQIDV